MPPKNSRMADACRAMKPFGISEGQTKAAVKELLKVYANSWEFIIDENYRLLLDFVLEQKPEEEKGVRLKKKEAPSYDKTEVVELPTKRYCTRQQKKQALSPLEHSTSCLEKSPLKRARQSNEDNLFSDSEESEDSQPLVRRSRRRHQEREVLDSGNNFDPLCNRNTQLEESLNLIGEDSSSDFDEDGLKLLEVESVNTDNKDNVFDLPHFVAASSTPKGDLEMSMICHSSPQSDFCPPHFDEALEMVEETHIKSCRVEECFVETGTDSIFDESTAPDVLASKYDHPSFQNELILSKNLIKVIPHIPKHIAFGCYDGLQCLIGFARKDIENIFGETAKRLKVIQGRRSSKLCKVEAAYNYHSSLGVIKSFFYIDDITRGEERVKVSLENGRNAEDLPIFFYIPNNLVYKNAYVKFSLARISHGGCCSHCFGDCLTSPIPCLCAAETGGQFAYTPGGFVTEKFLEECISLKRERKQDHYLYCRNCPLQRSKNKKSSVPCKGHLLQNFIKECWSKCWCNKKCGNRIVQQSITVKLQVFLTPEGKGWGLRTLEDLPAGAFVCEYVGEILTNTELHERNVGSPGNKNTCYQVLLDAGWGSKGVLKDEEVLCLDATVYGNVARFINHRCSDATLVEIPVEVETPDHHYYHIALFTTRKVDAMEELTWDYGIDFNDSDHDSGHPMKPFHCLCGSPFCRDRSDMKGDVRLLTYVRRRRRVQLQA
ncbi:PREDICTED: histone-lysine N-methyltransferase [Prunus dulcis]|uniref:PREDICTED: histone-lysine N-methyltransferase n=1 Tax=Prunus dulcis TaxID=3755 RepID=A0A5E4FM47_PRUDU|nr:probable inactive histone-lysine N-methyltransferase SUVR1 [Prunus dulcis]VVA28021.1 PREDICTED: histone-lysine N-methyltransferase [Prunus dulcis]